jgi:hypothetical protein
VVVRTPGDDELSDLVQAASSATAFWDTPLDDEEWAA